MAPLSAEYINQTKVPHILGLFWAFYVLSMMIVAAWLYIRGRMLRSIGPDDYIIVVSMVNSLPAILPILTLRCR